MLAGFLSIGQELVLRKEDLSIAKMPPYNQAAGRPVGRFLY